MVSSVTVTMKVIKRDLLGIISHNYHIKVIKRDLLGIISHSNHEGH